MASSTNFNPLPNPQTLLRLARANPLGAGMVAMVLVGLFYAAKQHGHYLKSGAAYSRDLIGLALSPVSNLWSGAKKTQSLEAAFKEFAEQQKTKVDNVEKRVKELEEGQGASNAAIRTLQGDLEKANKQVAASKEKQRECERKIEDLTSQVAATTIAQKQAKDDIDRQMETIATDLRGVRTEVQGLDSTLDQFIAQTSQDNSALKQSLQQLTQLVGASHTQHSDRLNKVEASSETLLKKLEQLIQASSPAKDTENSKEAKKAEQEEPSFLAEKSDAKTDVYKINFLNILQRELGDLYKEIDAEQLYTILTRTLGSPPPNTHLKALLEKSNNFLNFSVGKQIDDEKKLLAIKNDIDVLFSINKKLKLLDLRAIRFSGESDVEGMASSSSSQPRSDERKLASKEVIGPTFGQEKPSLTVTPESSSSAEVKAAPQPVLSEEAERAIATLKAKLKEVSEKREGLDKKTSQREQIRGEIAQCIKNKDYANARVKQESLQAIEKEIPKDAVRILATLKQECDRLEAEIQRIESTGK